LLARWFLELLGLKLERLVASFASFAASFASFASSVSASLAAVASSASTFLNYPTAIPTIKNNKKNPNATPTSHVVRLPAVQ
jgi:hypothetical protein